MPSPRIPLPVKLLYTAFLAALIPVYLYHYGPTNFLYFCDVALLLTLAGLWLESPLLISMSTVGILLPQTLWLADLAARLAGFHLLGMTDYMFDPRLPLYLRLLSLFHGWLPILLLYLVRTTGYDRRALPAWTAAAWILLLICYFLMPPPGSHPDNPNIPVNINYVFGPSDAQPQTWMPAPLFLAALLLGLPLLVFYPTHLLLKRIARNPHPT